MADHLARRTKPSDVCGYMPQFYTKPWNIAEARKRNPQHEDMISLHISATPVGRPAVEAFALECMELEQATAQGRAAPPTGQERAIQDILTKTQGRS